MSVITAAEYRSLRTNEVLHTKFTIITYRISELKVSGIAFANEEDSTECFPYS